jgi:signal transduction histidine kinase
LWDYGRPVEPLPPTVKDSRPERTPFPQWAHWAATIALTIIVGILDVTKPGNHGYGIFYLAPVLYVGWTIVGRAVLVLTAFMVGTLYLTAWIAGDGQLTARAIRNRSMGAAMGLLVAYALWDRRRFAVALEQANHALETGVAERTAALERANRSLSEEIAVRQRAEEGLRQAQKMEAIGVLAGGIAHDFNNLLTVINGYASLLQELLPADSPCREGLEQIAVAGEKATDVTHKLLAFGRRQVLQPSVLNLNEVLAGMQKLIGRLLPENIILVIQLDPALQLIRADRNELERALLNFAANARDAMPKGGEFRLATSQVNLTEAQVVAISEGRPGPHVRLTATDTGSGMSEATRQRIFEPFFTTKEIGKGTGLGLASVYGVIRQSGGHIEVASEIGRGTTFTVLLPCVAEEAPTTLAMPELTSDLAGAAETILLVEDDGSVRHLTELILKQAGYRVMTAADGNTAADLVARDTGLIRLVITDVVMPQLSGLELTAMVSRQRPDIKVLLITGYALGEDLPGGPNATPTPVLAKPFTAQTLLTRVGELLHPVGMSGRS